VKKLIILMLLMLSNQWLGAQDLKDTIPENSLLAFYLRFTAIFLLFSMMGYFIIAVIQQVINHKIRKKIIEHNIAEPLATQLLSGEKNRKKDAIKWMLVTASLALGILGANFVKPYGVYSIVIILLSLSVAFLLYYWIIKNDDN
jgi:hypothetical protein